MIDITGYRKFKSLLLRPSPGMNVLVGDNGPCFKSRPFERYIASRPELTQVRTRRRSSQTNGVIERSHGAIKIEHPWRDLPADGLQMQQMVAAFRTIYNEIRPHESLVGARPIEAYLPEPSTDLSTPVQTRKTARISWRGTCARLPPEIASKHSHAQSAPMPGPAR